MSKRTLLVSGASGHLGRAVIDFLLASSGNDHIVAGTRDPSRLKELEQPGIEIRELDFERQDTTAAAMEGVDRFLLISTDAVDRPGYRAQQHGRAVAAAARAGVKHIVYTSMPNPSEANPMGLALDHRGTEAAIAASGVAFTIVRNNWYFENLLGSLSQAIESGVLSDSTGDGRVGWISREDCARVAAAALASDETRSSVHNATGPELLGLAEIAERLSRLSGRHVVARPADSESRRRSLESAGLPAGVVEFIVNTETGIREGWLAIVSDDVKNLTGKRPKSLFEYFEEHRDSILGDRN